MRTTFPHGYIVCAIVCYISRRFWHAKFCSTFPDGFQITRNAVILELCKCAILQSCHSVAEDLKPGFEDWRSGDENLRPGAEDLRPVDEDLWPGDEDLRPGDEYLRPGDEDLRSQDEDLRPAAEDLRQLVITTK